MVDKQIVINGIDVSGCECFYINGSHPERKECLNPYCKGLCKGNPNCYYKQLKRAENQIVDFNKMVKTKEQECDRLKHDNDYEVGALEKTIDNLTAENEELKNCLDEIKEIANYSFNRPTSVYMVKLELILDKISEVEKC